MDDIHGGEMALYILMANGNPISFLLGFIHKQVFYEWKIAHDPAYEKYTPGNLVRLYSINDLIKNNIQQLNFMAGGYEYKRRLAPDGLVTENFSFYSAKHSLKGWLLLNYYMKWRDILKQKYQELKTWKRLQLLKKEDKGITQPD